MSELTAEQVARQFAQANRMGVPIVGISTADRVDLQKQAVMVFGGPVLGPFTLRKDALKAESNWINLFLAKYYDETFAQSIGQTASTE